MANFKVSARTVDMLGRQQIAGIPTAISELFKNAHDAYADNVEVDYYREDGLFVLRDDGLGMTREEFEQRWLTLGTDSKLAGGSILPPPIDRSKKTRPVLGEKGIGRLAIALIGSQVLILTKAKHENPKKSRITAAYIHWGMFELPGFDLSYIPIPIRDFEGGSLPSGKDVREMVDEATKRLKTVSKGVKSDKLKEIYGDMADFSVDPDEYSKFLGKPSLVGEGCGTHFYILPADPLIESDIDNSNEGATRFEKSLIGFTNTMTPGYKKPVISTRIRDHRNEAEAVELIGDKAFFTPAEFSGVDHHVNGSFDAYGQFTGAVTIYHTEPEPYTLNWPEGSATPTECGPFDFSFAFLQGDSRNSLVSPEEHSRLRRKLNKFGGLYVYRDGIRVQPYGDSDYDFLHVEKRRTLSAGYYVYSYRRIMGTIELTSKSNSKLMEKAGREGFSENRAYRQFRSILTNFFLQSAADFFRDDGRYAADYSDTKDELERLHTIRKANEKKRRVKKAAFTNSLTKFFEDLNTEELSGELSEILAETEEKLDAIVNGKSAPTSKALALLRTEKDQRQKLDHVRSKLVISKPRGLVSNAELRSEWSVYQSEFADLESSLLSPTEAKIEKLISEKVANSKIPLEAVTRLEERTRLEARTSVKQIRALKADTNCRIDEISQKVSEITKRSFDEINSVTNSIIADIGDLRKNGPSDDEFSETRKVFEERLSEAFENEKENLERLRDQILLVSQAWDEGYSSLELIEALGYENEELSAQNEVNLELAQIGMAINTINHEFEKTVGSLRSGFSRLSRWADFNPEIQSLYSNMRTSFDHLDSYLALFTPFDRRLNRTQIDITGKNISDFLNDLFEARFKRHGIKLEATSDFLNSVVHGFPSSFYPVFVNLIDNSIFWLSGINDRSRKIELDYQNGSYVVLDNGPGVGKRDQENIFALRFSRKPAGRGMGLAISRETLGKVGFELALDSSNKKEGAKFVISPKNLLKE